MYRRGVLLAVLLVAAGLVGAALVDRPGAGPPATPVPAAQERPPAERLASPAAADGYVWPYTSRSRSVDGRTLALNVVVHGDTDRVRRVLTERSGANWTRDRNAVRVSPWRPTHGSVRYTYRTAAPNATGRWTAPEYQLHVGTYFGHRTHVRAYATSGDWTALQAHTEYWDWFRVRHTVTGVRAGAAFVERDLRDEPAVANVSRTEHGLTGGGSPGWWAEVELVSALLLGVAAVPLGGRLSRDERLLPVALVALVLGVRAWGLAAEAVFPAVNPKLFVALGYPVLAAGPPLATAALAREATAARAGLLAAGGLLAGIVLDMAVVGISGIPAHLVQHRVALAAALGLCALGVARADRRVVGAGVVVWGLALLAPLFGLV